MSQYVLPKIEIPSSTRSFFTQAPISSKTPISYPPSNISVSHSTEESLDAALLSIDMTNLQTTAQQTNKSIQNETVINEIISGQYVASAKSITPNQPNTLNQSTVTIDSRQPPNEHEVDHTPPSFLSDEDIRLSIAIIFNKTENPAQLTLKVVREKIEDAWKLKPGALIERKNLIKNVLLEKFSEYKSQQQPIQSSNQRQLETPKLFDSAVPADQAPSAASPLQSQLMNGNNRLRARGNGPVSVRRLQEERDYKRARVEEIENQENFARTYANQSFENDQRDNTDIPKQEMTESEDGIVICMLSDNRSVRVRQFNRSTLVDIREFYEKGGQLLPGRKGISLSVEQIRTLFAHQDEIEKAIERLQSSMPKITSSTSKQPFNRHFGQNTMSSFKHSTIT